MKIAIFILSIFILCSCHRDVSEYAKVIIEDKGNEWSLYVKDDSTQVLIPLETTEESLIGEYDQLLMTDSLICVLDYSKSRSIFIFDGKGSFKCKIMKVKINKLACALIDELGGVSRVAGICNIKPASVCGWRTHGIPQARYQFLRLAYPRLKCWSLDKAAL